MLRYATENGYDKLSWITGEQQNDRYDLSKKIDYIQTSPGIQKTIDVFISMPSNTLSLNVSKDGHIHTSGGNISLPNNTEKLEDVVGKDMARNILENDNNRIEGVDLKVGGAGMKGFYDNMIPRFLNKYAKKWGAKVGSINITQIKNLATMPDSSMFKKASFNARRARDDESSRRLWDQAMRFSNDPNSEMPGWITNPNDPASKYIDELRVGYDKQELQPSIDITPEMRESVLQGQPQFQKQLRKPGQLLTELKEIYDSGDYANKAEFIRGLKELGYDSRTVKRASVMFGEISTTPEPKRIQKETERLEKTIEKPATIVKKYSSTLVRDRIKHLKRGAEIGEVERTQELKKLKKIIAAYARENLPKYEITRGQITPLLTQVAEAKNINDVARAFDRIDAIRAKVHKKVALRQFANTLKKYKPKTDRGKIIGKHLMPKEYRDLNSINSIIGLQNPDDIVAQIMVRAEEQGRDLSQIEEKLVYLVGTYGGIKTKSVEQILVAIEDLENIIDTGKTVHQYVVQQLKDRDDKLRRKALMDITDKKGLLDEMAQRNIGLDKKRKRFSALKNFLYSNQSFEWMMDIFDRGDKAHGSLEGFMAKYFGGVIHEATLAAGKGTREKSNLIHEKISSIYGKDKGGLLKIFAKNMEVVKTGIMVNEDQPLLDRLTEELEEADGNARKGLTEQINQLKVEMAKNEPTELIMSKNEAYKKWMEWKDAELVETFEKMGWTEETIKDVEKFIGPELIEWAEWQLDFYDKYYDEINEKFKERFYIDLPRHENYSPRQREGKQADIEEDQFLKSTNTQSSLVYGSMLARVRNTRKLKFLDGDTTLMKHIVEMEQFKAWIMPMRELRSIFNSEEIQQAIKQEYGVHAAKLISNFLDDMSRGGVNRALIVNALDRIRSRFVKSKIALTPVISLKQLASIPAFAVSIPAKDFASGMIDYWKNPIDNFRTLMSSEFMIQRYDVGFERDIVQMLHKTTSQRLAGVKTWSDMLTWNVKLGDGAAIIVGGWSVYKYAYKKAIKGGKTVEQAKKIALTKFERVSDNTQQSANIHQLSSIQRGGSWAKLFTTFITAQNQYFRAEMGAIRNLARGRGSKAQHAKTIIITHFILPMLFQFIASGFRWEKDKELRAMLLGSLNGILVVGDLMERMVGVLLSGWSIEAEGDLATPFGSAEEGLRLGHAIHMALKDDHDIDFEEAVTIAHQLAITVGSLTGIAYSNVTKLITGWSDYIKRETDDERRLLGYSDWVLGNREKKSGEIKRETFER